MINNKVTYLYSKEDNFDQKLNEFLRSRNISDVNICLLYTSDAADE